MIKSSSIQTEPKTCFERAEFKKDWKNPKFKWKSLDDHFQRRRSKLTSSELLKYETILHKEEDRNSPENFEVMDVTKISKVFLRERERERELVLSWERESGELGSDCVSRLQNFVGLGNFAVLVFGNTSLPRLGKLWVDTCLKLTNRLTSKWWEGSTSLFFTQNKKRST